MSFLTNEKGEEIPLSPSCLLVFVDETGDEGLGDPNYPIFGLGACVVLESDYGSLVRSPWNLMKEELFDAPTLHCTQRNYGGPPKVSCRACRTSSSSRSSIVLR